jgi:hypothetical protein
MGCVWQSEYAPVPRLTEARLHERPAARHRKPGWWERSARPVLAVARAQLAAWLRPHPRGLAVAARER